MRSTTLLGIAAAVLLAGCSTVNDLTPAGQSVRFSDSQPGGECRLLGQITGSQSTWLSGGGESASTRGAANDLRNKAAAMGGNVIYGVTTPSQTFWSSFVPLDSKMAGQVYHCP